MLEFIRTCFHHDFQLISFSLRQKKEILFKILRRKAERFFSSAVNFSLPTKRCRSIWVLLRALPDHHELLCSLKMRLQLSLLAVRFGTYSCLFCFSLFQFMRRICWTVRCFLDWFSFNHCVFKLFKQSSSNST